MAGVHLLTFRFFECSDTNWFTRMCSERCQCWFLNGFYRAVLASFYYHGFYLLLARIDSLSLDLAFFFLCGAICSAYYNFRCTFPLQSPSTLLPLPSPSLPLRISPHTHKHPNGEACTHMLTGNPIFKEPPVRDQNRSPFKHHLFWAVGVLLRTQTQTNQ